MRISCEDLPSGLAAGTQRPVAISECGPHDIGKRPLKEITGNIERELINEALTVYKSWERWLRYFKWTAAPFFARPETALRLKRESSCLQQGFIHKISAAID